MKLLLLASVLFVFVGCQGPSARKTDSGLPNVASEIKDVSPADAQLAVSKAYSQFVDVRTPEEYAGGHAARSVNIPLETLSTKLDSLEKGEPVYLICQSGNRSKNAAVILKEAGFRNVLNVDGGTIAWQAAKLPMETRSPHVIPSASTR